MQASAVGFARWIGDIRHKNLISSMQGALVEAVLVLLMYVLMCVNVCVCVYERRRIPPYV